MLDPSIFSKYKSKQDFDLERQEFEQRKRQQAMKEQLGQLQLQQAQSEMSQPKMPFQGTGLESQLINQKYMANLQAGMDKQQALQNATDTVLQSQVTTDARGNTLTRRPIFGSPAQINQMPPSEVMGMPTQGMRQDSGMVSPTMQQVPNTGDFMPVDTSQPDLPMDGLPNVMVDPTQFGVTSPYGREDVAKKVAEENIKLQGKLAEQEALGEISEREKQEKAAIKRQEQLERSEGNIIQDVGRAIDVLENYGGLAAGTLPGLVSGISETPSGQIKDLVTSAKSNISIQELQAMREASPTGGALGQVPVQQQEYLMQLRGSLSEKQKPEILLQNLKRVQNTSMDIIHGTPLQIQQRLERGEIDPQTAQKLMFRHPMPFDYMGRQKPSIRKFNPVTGRLE